MEAAYIEAFAPNGNIKVGQLPHPKPAEGEVCIAVAYAGVNPVDGKIAEGKLQSRIPHQFPLILGWEVAGTVHELGKGVTSLKKGDPVYAYCRKPIVQWGCWAEFVTFPAEHVALKPTNLSTAEASGVPLAGLTAWQALFEKAHLKAGQQVLIHGGGGGVGGYGIQWAKNHRAHVITTASVSKFSYVQQFHPDEIIDYHKDSFVAEVRKKHPAGIDVVFDTVGGQTYKESFEVLKPGGCIVSLLEQPDEALAKKHQVRAEYHFVQPNAKELHEIARLFESGKAIPQKVHEFPLDEAAAAVEEIRKGSTTGKIVLKVSS